MKIVLRFLQIPEKISGTPGSPHAMLEKITTNLILKNILKSE